MKNNYLVLLLCGMLYLQTQAQNNPNQSATAAYQESLNKKEDFWSKVKSRFKPKEKTTAIRRTSDPVLVKNDPNRMVQRPQKSSFRNVAEKTESKNAPEAEGDQQLEQKRTLGSVWSKLVNGNDYVAPKKYNQVKKPAAKEEDYMAMGKIKKAERAAAAKTSTTPARPVVRLTPEQKLKQQQTAKQNAQYYASLNKKSGPKSTPAVAAKESLPAPEPEVVDNTIRNEIKPLSLLRAANGTASYFATGFASGKFFVHTNLASKGSVVKITNPQNGRSLLAEVIEPLTAADAKRGVLLKLSDNAKMPLGQNNNSFTVKVNY